MLSVGVLVLVCVIAGTQAYSNGAPHLTAMDNACTTGDMRPKHESRRTKVPLFPSNDYTRFPFRLEVQTKERYRPGGPPITMILRTVNPTRQFMGFLISADAVDAKMGVRGHYEPAAGESAKAKRTTFCGEAITHTNKLLKQNVTVKWIPPAEFTHGRIQFKATVVESFSKFYTGIRSQPVDAQIGRNIVTQSVHTQKKLERMMSGQGGSNGMMGAIMAQMQTMFPRGNQPGGGQAGRVPAGLPQRPAMPPSMQQILG